MEREELVLCATEEAESVPFEGGGSSSVVDSVVEFTTEENSGAKLGTELESEGQDPFEGATEGGDV